jgi:hypothetical protein
MNKPTFHIGTSLLYALGLSLTVFLLIENLLRWNDHELWLPNDWLNLLLNRVLESNFCLFIIAVFTILFVYGLLQLIGVSIDRIALDDSQKPKLGDKILDILRPMTGRPNKSNYQKQRDISHEILMAPLSFGIWLMPLLGFIGTIIGISGTIAELPKIRNQEDNLSNVLGNLYIAFDTTFLGLICAIFLAIIFFIIQNRWRTIDYILGTMQADTSDEITDKMDNKG